MESADPSHRDLRRAGAFPGEAAVTITLVVLAGLALDDITTDNSTGFKPEYTLLATCGAWALFLAYDLLKHGYWRLGTTSMVAVALAVSVASDGLGHKRDGGWSVFWTEYAVMLVVWLWFLALAIVLIALGRRVMPTGDTALGSLDKNCAELASRSLAAVRARRSSRHRQIDSFRVTAPASRIHSR